MLALSGPEFCSWKTRYPSGRISATICCSSGYVSQMFAQVPPDGDASPV